EVPRVNVADLANTLHPPLRKALLAELGGRDPSLAYCVACHLWARDLALLGPVSATREAAENWALGTQRAALATARTFTSDGVLWSGEFFFVPARGVQALLLLAGDQLAVVPVDAPGLRVEPLGTLGLRGAGLARGILENLEVPQSHGTVDLDAFQRTWRVL